MMRTRNHALILLGAGVVLAVGMLALRTFQKPSYWQDPVDQWAQVTFSHKQHVEEIGAECSDCHAAADTSRFASDFLLPRKADCAVCHEVEDEAECSTCHAQDIPREAYAQPVRELVFSHQAHLAAGAECATCHAGVEASVRASVAYLPSMTSCTTCHDGLQRDATCETCHSMLTGLLPFTHRQVDWAKEHKRFVRLGTHENDCAACHTESDCQTCHAGVTLQFTDNQFGRPVSEFRPALFGSKSLVLQSVHELNYRFTHALDFRAKRSDCASCHDQQAFCAACHEKNQDAGFKSPFPSSHSQPDFIRLGVGSGGGLHATLARRDIESCAACHDVQGRDAACVTCHVDRTPGLGNDPKTHPANFRRSAEEAHSSDASCLNCHTSTRQAGIGYCGYCHGVKEIR